MKTLNTEQLHKKMLEGPVALFDVRGDTLYEQGHIPDAKTAPLGSLVFRVAHLMNPGSFVAVYSNGGDCRMAAEAVERLEGLKMTNVHCYEGGLSEWKSAGLPVIASVEAKTHTHGPVQECRPLVVDRERAYGGAFKEVSQSMEGAGG